MLLNEIENEGLDFIPLCLFCLADRNVILAVEDLSDAFKSEDPPGQWRVLCCFLRSVEVDRVLCTHHCLRCRDELQEEWIGGSFGLDE